MGSPKLQTLLQGVLRARDALTAAEAALAAHRAARRIKCASCPKHHPIGVLTLVITHWYQQPYGCSGGDYWSPGDWCFVCPTTGRRNRLLFNDYGVEYKLRGDPAVAGEPAFQRLYERLFAKVENVKEHDHEKPPSVNNYDVDLRRAAFELPAKPVKAPSGGRL